MTTFWGTPQGGDATLWQLLEGTTDLYFSCIGSDGDDDKAYAWRASDGKFRRIVTEDTEKSKFAQIVMPTNATVTTISSSSTPVLVVGTWTADLADGFTTTTGGRITYTGTETQKFFVFSGMAGDTSSGANINFTQFFAKNGTVIASTGTTDRLDSSDIRYFNNEHIIELSTSDYLEVFIQNDVNTTNITMNKAKFGLFPLPYMV